MDTEPKFGLEALKAAGRNAYHNRDNEVEYLEQRNEDLMDLLLDQVNLTAGICSELRGEIELLRADLAELRAHDSAEAAHG